MSSLSGNKANTVLGIGNALVDIMIAIPEDSILNEFGLPRGSMTLVDRIVSSKIYDATLKYQVDRTTGGSAANTIHGLASLGGQCGYAGKIGRDELGRLFSDEFRQIGVSTHLPYSDLPTGRVMAMVSTDSERTMATFLGAAAELTPADFPSGLLRQYEILYVEGYLVQDHNLIETILKTGHEQGLQVAIDLSSYNIVAQNLDFLKYLVRNYVDIVFANEEEAHAFTGLQPADALEEISKMCDIAVVKTGKKGSMVREGENVFIIDPVEAAAVDTTGAGDSYAAGFLYGLTRGLPLKKCGDIASLTAAKAVESMGARIPESVWLRLLEKVRNIEEA